MPSQPVQSCGLATAALPASIVSPPTRTTWTSARWIDVLSTVGDASTRCCGPPATAGAARARTKTVSGAIRRRMVPGKPCAGRSKTPASARADGVRTASALLERRFLEHLAEAAFEVVGLDADVAQDADRAAVLVAQQPEQEVFDAEVAVAQALRLAQRLLERVLCGVRDRHTTVLGRARRRGRQAETPDGLARRVEVDADRGQRRRGGARRVGHEPEQEVARVDLDVPHRPRRGAAGPYGPPGLRADDDAVGLRLGLERAAARR